MGRQPDWVSKDAHDRQRQQPPPSEAEQARLREKMLADARKAGYQPGDEAWGAQPDSRSRGTGHHGQAQSVPEGVPEPKQHDWNKVLQRPAQPSAELPRPNYPQAKAHHAGDAPQAQPAQSPTEARTAPAEGSRPAPSQGQAELPRPNYPLDKTHAVGAKPQVTNVFDAHNQGLLGRSHPPEASKSPVRAEAPKSPARTQVPKPQVAPEGRSSVPAEQPSSNRLGMGEMANRTLGATLGPLEAGHGVAMTVEGIKQKDAGKVGEGSLHIAAGGGVTLAALFPHMAEGAMKVSGAAGVVLASLDTLRDAHTAATTSVRDEKIAYGTSATLKAGVVGTMLVDTPTGLAVYGAGTFGWWLGRQVSEHCGWDEPLTKGMGYYVNSDANQGERERAEKCAHALQLAQGRPIDQSTGHVDLDPGTRALARIGAMDQVELARKHGDEPTAAYYMTIFKVLKA